MKEYILTEYDTPFTALENVIGELIRCKDCKYWDDHWAGLNVTKCKAFDWLSKPDDFCSFAERKEE